MMSRKKLDDLLWETYNEFQKPEMMEEVARQAYATSTIVSALYLTLEDKTLSDTAKVQTLKDIRDWFLINQKKLV